MKIQVFGNELEGFDGKYPWQMVPYQGSRDVSIIGAFDKLTIEDPIRAKIGPAPAGGSLYRIDGLATGKTRLLADGNPILEIELPTKLLPRLNIIFVDTVVREPGKKPRIVRRCPAEIADTEVYFKTVNDIYEKQANKQFNKGSIFRLGIDNAKVDRELGAGAWFNQEDAQEEQALLKRLHSGSGFTAFLAPWIAVGDNPLENLFAGGGAIIGSRWMMIETSFQTPASVGAIIAHELGHCLSLPHDNEINNLMYFTDAGGRHLTRKQIDAVRRESQVRRKQTAGACYSRKAT